MIRPTRSSPAGRAYLDLQNRARAERRGTQELLIGYVVERWLARLSRSPYADSFVVKGGTLLAAFDARRPTIDLDSLARRMANDEATVVARVVEIAGLPGVDEDGVEFRTDTVTSRIIRDEAMYSGLRVGMDCSLATAVVKFRMDVNFGDPITPAPRRLALPSLRPSLPAIHVLGYPIETLLAEKVATAIELGPANTRVRDYADIYTLTGRRQIGYGPARDALLATAGFRGTRVVPLSSVVDNLIALRRASYAAYRAGLGPDGQGMPADFADVVAGVIAFADPVANAPADFVTWDPATRSWISS